MREIEQVGDDLNSKFRSEILRGGRSEKVVIKTIMDMNYKDERTQAEAELAQLSQN